MFIYCITPYDKIECNFIKIGICQDVEVLKERYKTYYGNSCRYYYVKVDNKKTEIDVHNYLKNLGNHLENELFLLNKKYDFYFYTQILEKYKTNITEDGIIKNKDNNCKRHTLEFIVFMFNKMCNNFENNEKNIIISYFSKSDFEKVWLYYLSFCIEYKQYFRTKKLLKNFIQSMIYTENPIKYENYEILFNQNNIKIKLINKEYKNNISSFMYMKNILKENGENNCIEDICYLYILIYLDTVYFNYNDSITRRLIYYENIKNNIYIEEILIFKKIYLGIEILKILGFDGIFDSCKININKSILIDYIINKEDEICKLLKINKINIRKPSHLIFNKTLRFVNIILSNIFLIHVCKIFGQDLFFINFLNFRDEKENMYKYKNIINKIGEEEEYINNEYISIIINSLDDGE